MPRYTFPLAADRQVSLTALGAQAVAAGFVYANFGGMPQAVPPAVFFDFAAALSPVQELNLGVLVAAYDGRPRRSRSLFVIRGDLNALTNTQKKAVWTDLSSGSPPKWALDTGPNAAAISAIEWAATVPTGVTVVERREAQLRLVAMYTQDNPSYLVAPAFDATINVPGDEPYTP